MMVNRVAFVGLAGILVALLVTLALVIAGAGIVDPLLAR
jgi:hypothetical protein